MKRIVTFILLCVSAFMLAACNPEAWDSGKHLQPLSAKLKAKIRKIGSTERAALYVRIYKEEGVLEAWKQTKDGTYALLKSYPICAYSGKTGPKKREGDRQAPEGFYTITPGQMNPNSSYYLSFNLGYPNKYDRAYGRTGAHLMVHGSCSSRGCYAMNDEQIAEIYALGREAFAGGQRAFQVHAFPFRMTAENMARNRNSEHFAFWQNLKNGYDHFQITRKPPHVEVCNRTYIFNPQGGGRFNPTGPCPDYTIKPQLLASLTALRNRENVEFQQAVASLEQKATEQQEEESAKMVEAQLELEKRKERIAAGKNPDGFLVGLIKGNPTAPDKDNTVSAADSPAQAADGAASEAGDGASGTDPDPEKNASSGSFFKKLGAALPNPFK